MLILQPTAGQKTITIAPRKAYVNTFKARVLSDGGVFEISDCFNLFIGIGYSLKIRRDGDGVEENLSNLYISGISNFTQVKFEPTIEILPKLCSKFDPYANELRKSSIKVIIIEQQIYFVFLNKKRPFLYYI